LQTKKGIIPDKNMEATQNQESHMGPIIASNWASPLGSQAHAKNL